MRRSFVDYSVIIDYQFLYSSFIEYNHSFLLLLQCFGQVETTITKDFWDKLTESLIPDKILTRLKTESGLIASEGKDTGRYIYRFLVTINITILSGYIFRVECSFDCLIKLPWLKNFQDALIFNYLHT